MFKTVTVVMLLSLSFVFLSGCGDSQVTGIDAGPKAAFDEWLEIMEMGDFSAMWDKLSMTGKERFRYSWEDEKENLAKSSEAFKQGFMKRYGFKNFDEVKNEDARSFFVRSMAVSDDGKFPEKYKVLKKSKIDKFEYMNNGNACILTFRGPKGNLLPLKMKLQKEGEDWQIIRMP